MSKFNKKVSSTKIVNHAGGEAFKLDSKLELYSSVCTSLLSDSFYESADNKLKRIKALIKKVPTDFVAKLAIYAREQMNLRSIPIVLAVELSKVHKGDSLVSKCIARIIQRADEIAETMSYFKIAYGITGKLGKINRQIKVGLANAFNKFNEYQFAKYNQDKDIKLRDVMFLCHPKPKDKKQEELFKKIADKKLEVPYTWETQLSELGKQKFETQEAKQKAFKEKWEELIDSNKIGYMALLRNLRNFLDYDISVSKIENVCKILSDKEQVLKSKQLPFRFYSAFKEVSKHPNPNASMLLEALNKAALYSIDTIEEFTSDDTVLIACDDSGSMDRPLSEKSKIQLYEIGILLGILLNQKCKRTTFGLFSNDWRVINVPKSSNVLGEVQVVCSHMTGSCTNGYKVIEWASKQKIQYTKVLFFTDMQLYNTGNFCSESINKHWDKYTKENDNTELYIFDLSGLGQSPINLNNKGVTIISGFSDKIFTMLQCIRNGAKTIQEIEKIQI